MTEQRSVEHATFAIERTYEAEPARVFAAWAQPDAKARWFGPSEGSKGLYELDFRVGGRELLEASAPDGNVYRFDALYRDIVDERRVVYSYDMHRGDTRISVSLATVEFERQGSATKLTFTEQAAFLDGQDTAAEREHGTGVLLDGLAASLQDRTS
jgi:uncharacterized protein YndB with AHSA1/START domain